MHITCTIIILRSIVEEDQTIMTLTAEMIISIKIDIFLKKT